MVILEMQFEFDDHERERFLDLLRSLPDRIIAESGCLNCALNEAEEDAAEISLFMNWRNTQAFLNHRRGRNHANLMTAMGQLRMKPRLAMSFGGNVDEFGSLLGEA